jgi:hypothetical protein
LIEPSPIFSGRISGDAKEVLAVACWMAVEIIKQEPSKRRAPARSILLRVAGAKPCQKEAPAGNLNGSTWSLRGIVIISRIKATHPMGTLVENFC